MSKMQIQLSLIVSLLMLAPLFGCVSKGNFENMVQERDTAIEQIAELSAERNRLLSERDTLTAERDSLLSSEKRLSTLVNQTEKQKQEAEQQRLEAEREAAEANALLARQQAVFDNLKSAFSEEQKQNQVQIEMLKSVFINSPDTFLSYLIYNLI